MKTNLKKFSHRNTETLLKEKMRMISIEATSFRPFFSSRRLSSSRAGITHLCLLMLLTLLPFTFLKAQEIRRAQPVQPLQGPTSTPDQQAYFLAGMSVPGNSPLYARSNSKSYLQHTVDLKRNWQAFESLYFDKQRAWSQSHVLPLVPSSQVVYYPFSGPDFLNANAFFPNAGTYILIGREPIGKITPPESLSETQIDQGLDNLRNTTNTILQFSFFITKDMRSSMERTDFQGVLPVIYTFLALSGHHISSVQRVTCGGAPGVRIQFDRGGFSQTLYYVQADLSNGSAGSVISWMRSFPAGVGYIKSCSYLLHEGSFSQIRDFLSQHCTAILQDDSGIPYRYLANNNWNIYLFGTYTRPISIFSSKYQPDLHQAYNTPGAAKNLPFGTGYNWRLGQSNLILAVKR